MPTVDSLVNWFDGRRKVMVALSGGVDSALVAYAAFQNPGTLAIAVTADYKTLSREELSTARQICSEIGIEQMFLDYNELENDDFTKNDADRCFHCRMELGSRLVRLAKEHGVDTIVDGTNLDDLGDYRPGIRALRQNRIRSPLVEAGFTKSDIRKIAKSAGLSVFDKPSNSCLASRIPWGQKVTAERLARIELGETLVKRLTNLKHVRVRDIDGFAKIEVKKEMLCRFDDDILGQLLERFKTIGFTGVGLDQEGYRPGKINVITE